MRNFQLHYIFILSFASLFCSCNHYYYAPEEGHLLTLSEKGDAKISVGGNSTNEDGNDSKGTNFTLQAGYSPINHLGIQGSYFSLKRKGVSSFEELGSGNGFIASGAIGTYLFIENNFQRKRKKVVKTYVEPHLKMKKGFLLDLYGGYSLGKVHNYYSKTTDSHLSFRKIYLQGGLHINGKVMGLSYTLKGVRLDYEKAVLNGDMEESEILNIQDITKANPFFLIENSLRFHLGIRQFRFFMTVNFMNDSYDEDSLDFLDSTFDAGIILELDEIFTKER